MSTFQYYDFYSIDRPLTERQQQQIDQLSSRSTPTPRRAIFEYHYSDFRHDPKKVLLDYFDMMLYVANWGAYRIMIKLPAAFVSWEALQPYVFGSEYGEFYTQIDKSGEHVIIDLNQHEEDGGGYWIEGSGLLDGMLGLRDQLLDGDYRLLYLAWLAFASVYQNFEEMDEQLSEPPVPPNLKKLDTNLQRFVDFWRVDEHVISAAATQSESVEVSKRKEQLAAYIPQLKEAEKEEILQQLLIDSDQAGYQLRQRLAEFLPKKEVTAKHQSSRNISEIIEEAAAIEKVEIEKQRIENERLYKLKMEAIGEKQVALWREAQEQASLKTSSGYRNATEVVMNLFAYYEYAKSRDRFSKVFLQKMEPYLKSQAFQRRLREQKIVW